jgi:hypothetical protein
MTNQFARKQFLFGLPKTHLLGALVVAFFGLNQGLLHAQSNESRGRGFEASGLLGYHFASNNVNKTGMSLNGICSGINLSWVQTGLLKASFTEVYGKPRLALTARVVKMNNTDTFGYSIAIMPSYELPVLQGNKYQVGVRLSYGVNFNTKLFNEEKNFDNRAIVSPINFGLDIGLRSNIKISDKAQLNIGAGLYHVSNGSMKMPNGGINIIYGEVGYSYFVKGLPSFWNQKTNYGKDFKPKFEYAVYGLVSHRELGYFDYITRFWIAGLSQQFTYKFNRLYSLGLGLDGYYDATQPLLYNSHLKVYDIAEMDKYYMALGLYQRFDIGKLFLPFGVYHYVYKMENVQEPVYIKFGLGFKPGKHIFYGLFFKGTINKKQQLQSDFMEFSLGYRL